MIPLKTVEEELNRRYGISKRTFQDWRRKGYFPNPSHKIWKTKYYPRFTYGKLMEDIAKKLKVKFYYERR